MLMWLHTIRQRLTRWFTARAHGRHAQAWLAVLAFTESSFFVVPPDALLVAMLLAGADRWRWFALLTTLASVAGAIAGYAIGWLFYDTIGAAIIAFYGLEQEIALVERYFDATAFWTIFAAAFTPIPYKVFVLAGGFFKINFALFVLASIAGRGIRFFLVAYLVRRYGSGFLAVASRYATIATYTMLVLVAGYLLHALNMF